MPDNLHGLFRDSRKKINNEIQIYSWYLALGLYIKKQYIYMYTWLEWMHLTMFESMFESFICMNQKTPVMWFLYIEINEIYIIIILIKTFFDRDFVTKNIFMFMYEISRLFKPPRSNLNCVLQRLCTRPNYQRYYLTIIIEKSLIYVSYKQFFNLDFTRMSFHMNNKHTVTDVFQIFRFFKWLSALVDDTLIRSRVIHNSGQIKNSVKSWALTFLLI